LEEKPDVIVENEILKQFLKSDTDSAAIPDFLEQLYKLTLFEPINDFLARPKKGFRTELIRLGFELSREALQGTAADSEPPSLTKALALFDEAIEFIHAGSLIIDDIEDQSQMRRGKKTLHELYGVPIALNAGNWLYFWPLMKLQSAELREGLKRRAIAACHQTLVLAHTGQALDIGTPVDQIQPRDIRTVVFKIIEFKSGALTSLAMTLGALAILENSNLTDTQVSGRCEDFNAQLGRVLKAIGNYGNHFGQLLQIYDDIGNLVSAANPQKQFEDLKLLRPSFVWSVLADRCSKDDYQRLLVGLKERQDIDLLQRLLAEHNILAAAKATAETMKQQWRRQLHSELGEISMALQQKIDNSLERLTNAY
jgi:geranylgeranyl pyrophosphate synthase